MRIKAQLYVPIGIFFMSHLAVLPGMLERSTLSARLVFIMTFAATIATGFATYKGEGKYLIWLKRGYIGLFSAVLTGGALVNVFIYSDWPMALGLTGFHLVLWVILWLVGREIPQTSGEITSIKRAKERFWFDVHLLQPGHSQTIWLRVTVNQKSLWEMSEGDHVDVFTDKFKRSGDATYITPKRLRKRSETWYNTVRNKIKATMRIGVL